MNDLHGFGYALHPIQGFRVSVQERACAVSCARSAIASQRSARMRFTYSATSSSAPAPVHGPQHHPSKAHTLCLYFKMHPAAAPWLCFTAMVIWGRIGASIKLSRKPAACSGAQRHAVYIQSLDSGNNNNVLVLHTLADDDAWVADYRVPANVQLVGPLHDALPLRRALYVVEPAALDRALRPACCIVLGQKGNPHDIAAEQLSLRLPGFCYAF